MRWLQTRMIGSAMRYCALSPQTARDAAARRAKSGTPMPSASASASATSGGSWPTRTKRRASRSGPRQTGSVIRPASSTIATSKVRPKSSVARARRSPTTGRVASSASRPARPRAAAGGLARRVRRGRGGGARRERRGCGRGGADSAGGASRTNGTPSSTSFSASASTAVRVGGEEDRLPRRGERAAAAMVDVLPVPGMPRMSSPRCAAASRRRHAGRR